MNEDSMRGFLILLGMIATACVLYFCTHHDAHKIDADVRQQVMTQLRNDATSSYEFIMQGVEVVVSGRDVTLKGLVASDAIRTQIEESVKRVLAVRVVDNQLMVEERKVSENPPLVAAPVAVVTEEVAAKCEDDLAALMKEDTLKFNSNKATIKETSQPLLDKLVSVAKACSGAIIDVHGHTDSSGDAARNVTLSKARAQTVADYFVANGVKATLNVFGHGADKPVDSNKTAEGRAKNRRIEFDVRASAKQ
jgi:outer membrane protein OmpA-like peptidoglycan-associated protein